MARRDYSPTFTSTQPQQMASRQMPQFQATPNTPESQQAFIQALDEILQRNKGGFTAVGADTSSNRPWRMNGAMPVAQAQGVQSNRIAADPFTPSGQRWQLPELPPEEPEIPMMQPGQGSGLESFISRFNNAVFVPGSQGSTSADANPIFGGASAQQQEYLYQTAGRDYPVQQLADGQMQYRSGFVGFPQSRRDPQPIATLQDGRILLDNGKVVQQGIANALAGISGLQQGIFGQEQTITQQYGNINPIEPTPGNVNYGTDFRTRDLSNRNLSIPVAAQVVQVLRDDGTRFGDRSGHQGYGNSVLLRLPSGEMIRMSHLSQMGDFKEGDIVEPGQLIGTPGQTGNTYGEHLDLEYYNAEGQIDNPENFQGFTNPNSLFATTPEMYQQPNQTAQNRSAQQQTPQPQQQQFEGGSILSQAVANTGSNLNIPGVGASELARGDFRAAANEIGQTAQTVSNAVKPMSPERQQLGQNVAKVGEAAGIPEVYGSELAEGSVTPGQAASYTAERYLPKTRIDTGFTELLRGDLPGAKQNFSDTMNRVGARIQRLPGEVADTIAPPAFASDAQAVTPRETLGQNIKGAVDSVTDYVGEKASGAKTIFSNAVEKPMQGLSGLKDQATDAISKFNPFNFDPAKMAGERKVGDESAGVQNILPGSLAKPQGEKNDIRDPFFKLGGMDLFSQYVNKDNIGDGALNLGVFNNEFYDDPNRIATVFGATNMAGDATQKYKDRVMGRYGAEFEKGVKEQFPTDKFEEGSVNDYIQGIRGAVSSSLAGMAPFTTKDAVFQEVKPTNQSRPGVNNSPYVSVNENLEKALRAESSMRAMPVGVDMNAPVKGASASLFTSAVAPKMNLSDIKMPNIKTPSLNLSGVAAPKEKPIEVNMPTLDDYLRRGKTAAQYYAETGQQSVADRAGGADKAATAQRSQLKAPEYYNQSSPTYNTPGAQILRTMDKAGSGTQAPGYPQGYTVTGSGANKQIITPGDTPVAERSAQLNMNRTQNNPGIFSQAAGVLKRLFNF